jgi:hypothetical protein
VIVFVLVKERMLRNVEQKTVAVRGGVMSSRTNVRDLRKISPFGRNDREHLPVVQ